MEAKEQQYNWSNRKGESIRGQGHPSGFFPYLGPSWKLDFELEMGAFELGSTVCPIEIKYNKVFVDAFWNSRKDVSDTSKKKQ
ncbi:hypothetical protein AgCh_025693 [Apium graveolens]